MRHLRQGPDAEAEDFPRESGWYGWGLTRVGSIVILMGMMQKIAVTLDGRLVSDLDQWVREGRYPNRSRALQKAAELLVERETRGRLARELALLDPKVEQALAEEGLGDESWPEY